MTPMTILHPFLSSPSHEPHDILDIVTPEDFGEEWWVSNYSGEGEPSPPAPVRGKRSGARGGRRVWSVEPPVWLLNGGVRSCAHCAVTDTPQWRLGPDGPGTLCNACGIRYKAGRLLPEYRPLASPTYDGVDHSNTHRNVLKIRRAKAAQGLWKWK